MAHKDRELDGVLARRAEVPVTSVFRFHRRKEWTRIRSVFTENGVASARSAVAAVSASTEDNAIIAKSAAETRCANIARNVITARNAGVREFADIASFIMLVKYAVRVFASTKNYA